MSGCHTFKILCAPLLVVRRPLNSTKYLENMFIFVYFCLFFAYLTSEKNYYIQQVELHGIHIFIIV